MSIRTILEALWAIALILGIVVPIVAGCATVPKVDGIIHVEFSEEAKEGAKDKPSSNKKRE